MVIPIIVSLIVVAIIVYEVIKAFYPKGAFGEKVVSVTLKALSDDYYIFNDVYIVSGNKTIQIDHVVVSPYGIFVIETKNYTGWIYGNDNQQYWIKNMYGNKYKFYNPVLQNLAHVKALKYFLGVSDKFMIPVIVFLKSAKLKCNTNAHVMNAPELLDFIKDYNKPVFLQVKRFLI